METLKNWSKFWFRFFYILNYHQVCAIANKNRGNSLHVPRSGLLCSAGIEHLYEGSSTTRAVITRPNCSTIPRSETITVLQVEQSSNASPKKDWGEKKK